MAQSAWEDTGEPLPKLEHVPRDESWTKYLPEGSTIIAAVGHGVSHWSQSGKIEVRLGDGTYENYFIKLSKTHVGKLMVEGEYESMRLLHKVSPTMVPKPIGQDHSPNGKFGFHVTTCNGTVQQYTKWTTSWEEFYIETLKDAFQLEEDVHGFSQEIADLLPALYEMVCPRLLRPLETEGRVLRPSLVHGDLWHGNAAIHAKTREPCIFDASALWAHNEYEMHIWRGERYHIGKAFTAEYFGHFGKSDPIEDWDDRNMLYSLVADLHTSILFKNTDNYRNLLIQSMKHLVDKFPSGYQGRWPRRGDKEAETSKPKEDSSCGTLTLEENVWRPKPEEAKIDQHQHA